MLNLAYLITCCKRVSDEMQLQEIMKAAWNFQPNTGKSRIQQSTNGHTFIWITFIKKEKAAARVGNFIDERLTNKIKN